jgi:hypothetical protein
MDLELIITPEIIESSIHAAFDSVNLINDLILYEPTDADEEKLLRNVNHLKIMIIKEWFISNLTDDQTLAIDLAIKNGTEYLENIK